MNLPGLNFQLGEDVDALRDVVRSGWRDLNRVLTAQGFDEVVDANTLSSTRWTIDKSAPATVC